MKNALWAVGLSAAFAGCAPYQMYTPEQSAAIAARATPIQLGETVQAEASDKSRSEYIYYRFSARPTQPVTVTLRSGGPDAGLALGARPGELSLHDYSGKHVPNRVDVNGPHAELRGQLPPSADGTYYIWVTLDQNGPYSLTLHDGLVVSQDILTLPAPIVGSTGKYMSPFTEDDTIAPWVEKGMTASVGANVGKALGSVAAFSASSDNLLLSLVGGAVGEMGGQALAIQAVGGWDYIKSNSDQSFESIEDLGRFLHYRHSAHPQYKEVLSATAGIYPELTQAMRTIELGY